MNKTFRVILRIVLVFGLLTTTKIGAQDDRLQSRLDAVKTSPNDPIAHFNLGAAYFNSQKYDLAIPEFKKCLQLNPGEKSAKELLELCEGLTAISSHDYSTAAKHFQEVLTVNPNNSDANRLLNQCLAKNYMDEKKYSEAVTVFAKILEADPKNLEAAQNLGGIYYQQKDYKKAVQYWGVAVKLQKDAQAYKFLALSYYNLGDFKGAIENYQQSIQIESSKDTKEQDLKLLDDVYFNLAWAQFQNGSYDEAAEAFDKAYKINPKDSDAKIDHDAAIDKATQTHMDKGNDFALKNQYSSAIEEWKAVLKYDPNNKPAQDFIAGAQAKQGTEVEKYYQEGQSYVQKGNSVQALNVWNKALEMDPENQKVKAAIAKIILKKGQKLKALLGQGDELYAEQDYPGALQKYQLALQNTPGNKEAKAKIKKLQKLQGSKFEDYLAKGKKYLITGQNKKAIDNLEMARSINSNDPNVNTLYNRAKLAWRKNIESLLTAGEDLFDKGSKEEAKNKFQSVLKEDPNNEKANDYIKRMTGQNEQKADAEKIKNLYYEGVNLYINGKIKEAIDKWNEVLKLDHNNTNAANNKKKATLKLQAIGQLSQ